MLRMEGRMENLENGPSWADMLPDALAKIFGRLSLEDMLTIIPRVCRSWRRVSQDALCWQIIDLDEWCRGRNADTIERLIKSLVNRSCGRLREFAISGLRSDAILSFIAQSGELLQVLRIPYSGVTDDCICQVAYKLPCITYLDISGCSFLSQVAIQAFGEHCASITHLKRTMHPQISSMVSSNDEEAFAIAQYMPQLKHLEMSYGLLSISGLKAVLEKCTDLEFLDVRGCWNLDLEETFIKECKKRFKVFHEPVVKNDIYSTDDPDLDASDYCDDSDLYSDMWGSEIDEIGMDMHEEEINGTLYFWPDMSS
eukprot:c28339_g3_i1 orf=1339-2274(+)